MKNSSTGCLVARIVCDGVGGRCYDTQGVFRHDAPQSPLQLYYLPCSALLCFGQRLRMTRREYCPLLYRVTTLYCAKQYDGCYRHWSNWNVSQVAY